MCAGKIYLATVVITSVVALLVLMAFEPQKGNIAANDVEELPVYDINSQGHIVGQIFVKLQ